MKIQSKKIERVFLLSIIVLLSLTFTGCLGVNSEFRSIRNHVLSNVDMDVERNVEIAIGPALISFASLFVSFAETEKPVSEIMRQISRVQVGVYEIKDMEENAIDYSDVKSLTNLMEDKGWKYIVRSRDRDEVSAVFVREDSSEELREMFVLAISDEEIAFVHVNGDLDDLIEIAVREHGLGVEVASN